MSCNINGFFPCDKFSVGGIKKIWIVPFADVSNYTYTDDELGKVTGFSAATLPVEYKTIESTFSEEYNGNGYNNYVHTLTASFAKLTYQKRNELEKLVGSYVTVLFKDKNGLCWIAGFNKPLKVNKHTATTGGDASMYNIILTGNSAYQVKQCFCFDPECFASFNGTELRTSTFTIEDASLFDFNGDWQIVADSDVLNYTPASALDPTDWSNPVTYNTDVSQLQSLVGTLATSIVLNYDSGTDVATITFLSSNTTYNFLTFNTQDPLVSVVNITLNLSFVLTATLSLASTTITVTDSLANVVYTGAPSDVISGTGLSGTVGNALIDVSTLYPGGTTFTASVENLACETREYIFQYENQVICGVDSSTYYDYGKHYELLIPKTNLFGLDYQKVIMFYDEYQFEIIPDIRFATSTFATIEAAILASLTADPNCPIIPSSIIIGNGLAGVSLTFYSTRENSHTCIHYLADDGIMKLAPSRYTTVMGIQTTAPAISNLTIFNTTTADTLDGLFGTTPINSGYTIEADVTLSSVPLINDVEIVFASGFPETTNFKVTAVSPSCPTVTENIDTAVCYDTTDLSITRKMCRFEANINYLSSPEITGNFVFDYAIGATPYTLAVLCPSNIDGNDGIGQLSQAVLTLPQHLGEDVIRVLNFEFDYHNWTYVLELDCSIDVVWDYIEGNDLTDTAVTFTSSFEADITYAEVTPVMNPQTSVQWIFNDYDGAAINDTNSANAAFTYSRNNAQQQVAYFFYDSGLNQVEVNILTGINPAGTFTCTAYDSSFVVLQQFSIASPGIVDIFGVGITITDVAWLSIENGFGLWSFVPFDSTTQSDIQVYLYDNKLERNIWGRFDNFNALTPVVFVPSPVVTSLLCP